jgi:hypothetical protein
MNKLFVIFLLISVYSCNEFTKRKALKILYTEIGSAPMPLRYFNEYQYSDGSVGYAHAYASNGSVGVTFYDTMGKPSMFENTLYVIERSHRLLYSRICNPTPSYEEIIGYHKAGKIEGRWYTYTEYSVKLMDSCKKQFVGYGGKTYESVDTSNTVFSYTNFFRLNKLETYKAGFLDGDFFCYDFDGKTIYKTKFFKGTGYYKHFSPDDGLLQEEGQYINGYKEGKWVLYYRDMPPPSDTIITFYKKGIQMER